jgi:hypothetical protein
MKTVILILSFSLFAASFVSAIPTDVTYAEGDATTRYSSGKQQETSIGDKLNTGDSLKTGKDGLVELDQKGVAVKVSASTVFTLREMSRGGQTKSVMSVALGSIKFRYDKLSGQEPMIQTNGTVAGVRGTEFSVFSGADGSTLIAVDSGSVTVDAGGKSVDLGASEGVEIKLGQPPGDKFVLHSDQVDYSKWNDEKLSAMLADPLAAMTSIETMMGAYEKDVADYSALFNEYQQKLVIENENFERIRKEKGEEAAQQYAKDVASPIMTKTLTVGMNSRFSALAALSLRRYIAGRLYLFMKARYIANPGDATYAEFLSRFEELLAGFEKSIVPILVKADI